MFAVARWVVPVVALLQAGGDEALTRADREQGQIEKWMSYYAEEAAECELAAAEGESKPLALLEQPVMRWHNPITGNGTTHGAVFVWTAAGRPEAIGTIFSYVPSMSEDKSKRWVAHAFHSLAEGPLKATHREATFWQPERAGVELQPIPGASEPAQSPAARLTQMRSLARQFTAFTDDGSTERDLRLLPQPVYRYRSTRADVLDGGLFAFVTGTDPEVILLIEARQAGEQVEWQYALARFSHLTLRAEHNAAEIWKNERPAADVRGTYRSIHPVAVRDSVLP